MGKFKKAIKKMRKVDIKFWDENDYTTLLKLLNLDEIIEVLEEKDLLSDFVNINPEKVKAKLKSNTYTLMVKYQKKLRENFKGIEESKQQELKESLPTVMKNKSSKLSMDYGSQIINVLIIENQETHQFLTLDHKTILFGRIPKIPSNFDKNETTKVLLEGEVIGSTHFSIRNFDENYYIKDEDSKNGTFLHISNNKKLILYDNMEFRIEKIKFSIHLKSFNEIELEYHDFSDINEEKSDIIQINQKKQNKVYFGFDENNRKESQFVGLNNEDLKRKHLQFFRNDNFLFVMECIGEIELKLIPKVYYHLKPETIFMAPGSAFRVVEVSEGKTKKCQICKKKIDAICFPCNHLCYCFLCHETQKLTSCVKCNKEIKDVLLIKKLKFL